MNDLWTAVQSTKGTEYKDAHMKDEHGVGWVKVEYAKQFFGNEIDGLKARIADLEAEKAELEKHEPVSDRWTSAREELPSIGTKVLLFGNGVVQEEVYTMDGVDSYDIVYFWNRDDLDEGVAVMPDQFWMPLPAAPKEVE